MLNFILPMCTGGVQLEEKAGAPHPCGAAFSGATGQKIPRDTHCAGTAGAGGGLGGSWGGIQISQRE